MEKQTTTAKSKITRRNYSRISGSLELPNLVEIQTNSYKWFKEVGIKEVFDDIYPITNFNETLSLEFVDCAFDEPKYSVNESKDRDANYAAPIRATLRLINSGTGEIKEQEVFMGDFPLMTDSGTFIINGAERVIVSQLVRSPGAYFADAIDKSGKTVFEGSIIPSRGTWLEFENDGKDVLKISEYVGYLNVVVFVPDDLSLVKGSPSTRRKFIDLELSKISPIYAFYLAKYNRLLKERNQYLKLLSKKNGKYDDYLETIDEQMVDVQLKVIEKRENFIERLSKNVKDVYKSIADNEEYVDLHYLCFIKKKDKEELLKLYKKEFSRDLKYLSTTHGIHKEDMKIMIDRKSAHQYASQGQQRTIVLSIKIALLELIKEEIGEYPILLLDDVLSELDDQRKTKLLDILNNRIQTFITTTSIDGIEHHVIKEAKKININRKEKQ